MDDLVRMEGIQTRPHVEKFHSPTSALIATSCVKNVSTQGGTQSKEVGLRHTHGQVTRIWRAPFRPFILFPLVDNSMCQLEYRKHPSSILEMYHTEVPKQHE